MTGSEAFLDYIGVRFGSTGTQRNYARAIASLERVTGKTDPAAITVRDLDEWSRATKGALADSTRRNQAFAIRSFFRFLHSRGWISSDPCKDFVPPISRRRSFAVLTLEEIDRLIMAPAPAKEFRGGPFGDRTRSNFELANLRDCALMAMMYTAALRATEAGRIKLDDFQLVKGGGVLKLLGKWAVEPSLSAVDQRTTAQVLVWIAARREKGIVSPWLFCSVIDPQRPLSYSAVVDAFDRRLEAAQISQHGRSLTLHTLRRSRATHMFEAGEPTLRISRTLRHASPASVESYVRQSASADRVTLASLPWCQLPGA